MIPYDTMIYIYGTLLLLLLSSYDIIYPPRYQLVCFCFPTPGRGLPYGSGLGLSRCLGPGECLHSFIQCTVCATYLYFICTASLYCVCHTRVLHIYCTPVPPLCIILASSWEAEVCLMWPAATPGALGHPGQWRPVHRPLSPTRILMWPEP